MNMKTKEKIIRHDQNNDGLDRRGFLECMAWAGTGMLWTVSGGVLGSTLLSSRGAAAEAAKSSFSFVQISDSHIGFNKEGINTDVTATLQRAIARINALPQRPDFILHTGDLTHLAAAEEFDTLEQLLKSDGAGGFVTPALLKLAPIWDPIRSNPRFEKLVAGKQP